MTDTLAISTMLQSKGLELRQAEAIALAIASANRSVSNTPIRRVNHQNAKFDEEWASMNGRPKSECDPAAVTEISKLRTRLVELEKKLAGSSDNLQQNARDLDELMAKEQ